MKQDPVWRSGRSSNLLARQPEVDAAIGRVAEREPGQDAIACDGVEIARDAMLHVVKPGRGRLADAVRFIAVPPAASEASDFAPCRCCKQRPPPAARRNRDDVGDGWMNPNKGSECLLHDPAEPCPWPLPPRLRQSRQ